MDENPEGLTAISRHTPSADSTPRQAHGAGRLFSSTVARLFREKNNAFLRPPALPCLHNNGVVPSTHVADFTSNAATCVSL